MASITSLGIHRPSAIPYLISEGLLPPEPSESLYNWQTVPRKLSKDGSNGVDDEGADGQEELLSTQHCVVWSRGGVVQRAFRFDVEGEAVTQAIFTHFLTSTEQESSSSTPSLKLPLHSRIDGLNQINLNDGPTNTKDLPPTAGPNFHAQITLGESYKVRHSLLADNPIDKNTLSSSRALVIILKTQAHIFFLSGTSHAVHLPFEVDTVLPLPHGLLLQRRALCRSFMLRSPTIPAVPPNSFAFPQTVSSSFISSSQGHATLADLQSSSTPVGPCLPSLSHLLRQTCDDTSNAILPRLHCLTDPLAEVGTVVAWTKTPLARASIHRRGSARFPPYDAVDPKEHVLYMSSDDELEEAELGSAARTPLLLAVTQNQESQEFSIWSVQYVVHQSLLKGKAHEPLNHSSNISRRRSSYGPGTSTGANTPVARNASHGRDSLGAGRSMVVQSRDALFDDSSNETEKDLIQHLDSALEDTDATIRSRRVSSLLARADLSKSYEKTAFTDLATGYPPPISGQRGGSFGRGSMRLIYGVDNDAALSRARGSHGLRSSIEPPANGEPQLEPMLEASDDDEASADTKGLTVGHRSHGLRMDLVMNRIHVLPLKSLNRPGDKKPMSASTGPKVFVLKSPHHRIESGAEHSRIHMYLLYPDAGSLTTLTLQIEYDRSAAPSAKDEEAYIRLDHDLKIHVLNVSQEDSPVDACKLRSGNHSRMLVLKNSANAKHLLSLQAPWATSFDIELPASFNVYNPFQIANRVTSKQRREGSFRRVISQGPHTLIGLDHSSHQNTVDLVDNNGTRHRIEIQLLPRSSSVSKMMDLCDSTLSCLGESSGQLLHIWWSALSWLRRRPEDDVDPEWTAFVLCLFSMAVGSLADQRSETTARQKKRKGGLLRSSSGANTNLESWETMLTEECNPCSIWPRWMKSEAWSWTMTYEGAPPRSQINNSRRAVSSRSIGSVVPGTLPSRKKSPYLVNCVALAREFKQTFDTHIDAGKRSIVTDSSVESVRMMLATLLIGLHLLREESKLNTLSSDFLHCMTPILTQLGGWLRWPSWGFRESANYMLESIEMDFWLFDDSTPHSLGTPAEPFSPPSILQFIQTATSGSAPQPYITLLDLLSHADSSGRWQSTNSTPNKLLMALTPRTAIIMDLLKSSAQESLLTRVMEMSSLGLRSPTLETLPESVAVPIRAALSFSQARPSPSLGKDALVAIGRDEFNMLDIEARPDINYSKPLMSITDETTRDIHTICNSAMEVETIGAYDGSAEVDRHSITRLLFKDDQRFAEATKLLHPLHAPVAKCVPEPDWSDTELLEAQQELAKTIAVRTLAVSTGRGCLFYSARLPLLTEKFPIHGFTLSCVMQPTNTTVTADKVAYTEEKVSWAFFHAGVEAGLSIATHAKGIDTSWILFNKPSELKNRHAGFLLALGLNGHLKGIARWVAFKYLTPKHTMTSIGFLLGLAASYLGTMNSLITRLLSVHVIRMLPPGAAELNLSPLTQTSGIMGIGLLYCNTQHRRMSEIMLSEMENLDQDDISSPQDSLRDEGYRLAAGFALGYINIGRGKDLKGLHDMHIVERLLALAVGTKLVNLVHILDKATAAATVAIALIFMKTQDAVLARKVDVPDTVHQFEYVRPDVFLLRTVARHLIMWHDIRATSAWMKKQLPPVYQCKAKLTVIRSLNSEDLPFFNIVAGLCLSIGFRFAGTGSTDVRNLLCHYLDQFMRICRLPVLNYDSKLTRITVRNCQDVVALAAACVMAGTGDLHLLRRLRSLHGRTEVDVPYGSHLATHLALGMIFLGGGTHTFSTSNVAIASLFCALYPLFPTTILDNKSHLQAFRHFWVLAAEPRCLVIYDLDTRRLLSLPVIVKLKDGSELAKTAPCLLPELDTIVQVETNDPEYWRVTVDLADNPAHLQAFKRNQSIYVRQRAIYNAHVSIFGATTQALNDAQSAHRLGRHIFEWVFTLSAFEGFNRAERALVLPPDPASTVYKNIRSTVVDDRLVLEKACLDSGRIERLWNLKILFAWADYESRNDMKWGWIGQEVVEALRARLRMRKRTQNVSYV